jgi:hypothetical protein
LTLKRLPNVQTICIATLIVLLAFGSLSAQEQTVGLFMYDTSAYEGYTLFAPMRSTTTHLIDMYGRSVHSWEASFPPLAFLPETLSTCWRTGIF